MSLLLSDNFVNLITENACIFEIYSLNSNMFYHSVGIDSNTLRNLINKDKNKNANKKVTGIIGQVRGSVEKIAQEDRMNQAETHFINALYYKAPLQHNQTDQQNSVLNFVYHLQTWFLWHKLRVFASYIFMYLILITHKKPEAGQIAIESLFLLLFWADLFMEVFHKSYQTTRVKSRYESHFFLKLFILSFLLIDHLIAIVEANQTHFVRPFLVLRCTLPAIYDSILRKNIQAMMALYKDILVFVFFYFLVIFIFTVFVNHFIGSPQKQDYDTFTENYGYFGRALFIMYGLSAFESYPDNQIKVIRQHMLTYVFFIVFIFLNLFLFLAIPTSLLFEAFKQARSKIILVDEIRQQNSLIFAFCCLCEGDLEIQRTNFMKFLLKCFKNKKGYLLEIAKIAMQVDENQNQKIQMSQFIQIFKIMHSHPSLSPPTFSDWEPWINFRHYINQHFYLKNIVTDVRFKIIVCIFILLTLCNCLLYLFTDLRVFSIIDNIISLIFFIQLLIKFVGLGPENFFKDPWNKLDFVIILAICIFQLIDTGRFHMDVLIKLSRGYRLSLLPKYLIDKGKYVHLDHFAVRVSRLITQMLMTIPIVIQFFPMYLISFYFYGVMGMYIYSHYEPSVDSASSPYGTYDEIGNFNSFIYSQFFLVQVIIDAGWTVVAFDHCYRYPLPYWITLIFFTFTHLSVNLILGSLIKGVTWQVYETVQQQLNNQVGRQIAEQKEESLLKQRSRQLQQIKQQMNENKHLKINNLISREIFEGKIDNLIIEKMIEAANNPRNEYMKKFSKNPQMYQLIPKLAKQLNNNFMQQISMRIRNQHIQKGILNMIKSIENGESIVIHRAKSERQSNQQINKQIQHLIDQTNFGIENAYNEIISFPIHLMNFFREKIKTIRQHVQEQLQKQAEQKKKSQMQVLEEEQKMLNSNFNVSKHDIFKNEESKQFLTHSIRALLQMKNSAEEQKKSIVGFLVEDSIISKQVGETLLKKQIDKSVWLDPKWIVRQVFLDDKRQKSVQKFEIQFFSKIYGKDFREINKDTIKPLLRLESKITYCLRNLLRYPKISQFNFFSLLVNIENKISAKLLKKGSLFKFVFQIDSYEDSWLTFQLKQKQQGKVIRARFIKNGIWLWYKDMIDQQLYLSEDFFNWDRIQRPQKQQNLVNRASASYSQRLITSSNQQRCVKMLYQSFETLAMCLKDKQNFFIGNPSKYKYNMFTFYKDVTSTERVAERRFSISKIMPVILSNEGVRMYNDSIDPLRYPLSQMDDAYQCEQNQTTFKPTKLDQYYSEIYDRLGILETLDEEEKGDDQGLPFSYIVNLMEQIKATMNIYHSNFVMQVENLINQSSSLVSVSYVKPRVFQPNIESQEITLINANSENLKSQEQKIVENPSEAFIIQDIIKSESLNESFSDF